MNSSEIVRGSPEKLQEKFPPDKYKKKSWNPEFLKKIPKKV